MTGNRCAATVPGFPVFFVLICAEWLKRLHRKCFAFDRLITPTSSLNPTKLQSPKPLRRNGSKILEFPKFRAVLIRQHEK